MSRRKRLLAWGLLAAGIVLAAGAVALPSMAARLVRTRALPRLEERIGRTIDFGEVKVRWGHVELTDLLVHGGNAASPLAAPRVSVGFRLLPLLAGRLAVTTVALDRPRISIVRNDRGEDNVSDVLARLRDSKGRGGGGGAKASRSGPEALRVDGGTVTIEDDALGVLEVGGLDVRLARDGAGSAALSDLEVRLAAGPTARARRVVATFRARDGRLEGLPSMAVEDGEVRIWRGFAVSGVRGGITPDEAAPERVTIDLRGGYGGVDKVLWSAKGWAEPRARRGTLQLVAARFDLGQLAPILVNTPILDPGEAQADARLDLTYRPDETDPSRLHDALDFAAVFHLAGLNVFHAVLGPLPVRHLGFDATLRGRLEPRAHAVHVESADVDFRGLRAHLDLDASKLDRLRRKRDPAAPPGGVPPNLPAFRARLLIDPVPCQTALAALPPELVPSLQGFKLQGTFKSEVHVALDPDDLDTIDLGSKVGIDGCTVLQAPMAVAAERLRQTFDHAVEVEPGSWLAFPVGPENPEWVPFAEISPHLVNSIMTTEDSNFLQHKGFIGREFKSALRTNLEHGYFRLGASSITMQLVKNVLLSRDKTLARKLQEMFLTWYLERSLSKARILEIYFNVIEYGPGIYGIGRAAKHYFGKLPKDLLPREAAFFSSILPSPKRRYVHYCKGPELDLKWELYLNRILRKMHERGRLTDEEFEQAMGSRLRFDLTESMPADRCVEMVRRLTAPQAAGPLAQGGNVPIPLGRALDPAPVRVPAPPAAPEGDEPDDVPREP